MHFIQKTGNVRVNETFRHVCKTNIAMENQQVLHILSVCL